MSTKQYAYFSAAIRDGAKLRPQAFGSGLGVNEQQSCAHRAGREAIGGYERATEVLVGQLFPYMMERFICPACGDSGDGVFMLMHLNDVHRWTREAIADWLYEQEEALGFVTVVDPIELDTCNTKDNNAALEKCFVPELTERISV